MPPTAEEDVHSRPSCKSLRAVDPLKDFLHPGYARHSLHPSLAWETR